MHTEICTKNNQYNNNNNNNSKNLTHFHLKTTSLLF